MSQQCATWRSLPLTPVGRINLIKMLVLPKFTYLFRQAPVPIPKTIFKKLDSIVMSSLWKGAIPRIAKCPAITHTLGVLSLPCFIKYYWVAILVTLRWWLSGEPANSGSTLEVALLGSYYELRNLIY